jgi:hypothetical protein
MRKPLPRGLPRVLTAFRRAGKIPVYEGAGLDSADDQGAAWGQVPPRGDRVNPRAMACHP